MNTPIEVIKLNDFSGGYNSEVPAVGLNKNELTRATNVELEINGSVRKRRGYSDYSTAHAAGLQAGSFLFFWDQLGSANDWFILVDTDGDVHSETADDFSSAADFDIGGHTGGDDYPVAGAAFENVFYLTSLRANPRSFNGTSWTEITDITLDGDGGEFPKASFLVAKHDRMFAANIINNATAERSRVRWSDAGDAQTWGTLSWLDVDPDDGSQITGLASFADGIIIFKAHKMFFLSGVDADTFTLYPISTEVGCESPGTICTGDTGVYFYDTSRGVYFYDGTALRLLSEKIQSEVLATLDRSDTEYPFYHGFFFDNKYFLSGFQPGPSGGITYVYHVDLKAWTHWGFALYGSALRQGVLHMVGTSANVGIWKLDPSVATDDGVAFTTTIRTGAISFDEDGPPSSYHVRLRGIDVQWGDRDEDVSLTAALGVRTVLSTFDNLGTEVEFDLSAATNDDNPIVRLVSPVAINSTRLQHTSVAVNISDSSDDRGILSGINIYYSKRRSLRKNRGGVFVS